MKTVLRRILYFCLSFRCLQCFDSRNHYYTLKNEYRNSKHSGTAIFGKISTSSTECSAFCSSTTDCNFIFFNTNSGECKGYDTVEDGNTLQYMANNKVYKKTNITGIVASPTGCPNVTEACGKPGYVKIVTQPDISPCFKVFTKNESLTQLQAKMFCNSEIGRLLVLSNNAVYELMKCYISSVYHDITPSTHFWLGMEYINGLWTWYDTTYYPGWNNTGGNRCVLLSRTGTIGHADCASTENFICEVK